MAPLEHPFQSPPATIDDAPMEEAITWFTRLRAGEVSQDECIRFARWRQDPARARAYAEVLAFWEQPQLPEQLSGLTTRPPLPQARARYWPSGLAALGLAGVMTLYLAGINPLLPLQADAYTGVGESRTVTLADGSTLVLNTDSAVTVTLRADQRRVRLLKGEALFEVRADPARPFVVETTLAAATVLGTRFVVRDSDDSATVTVARGAVEVTDKGHVGSGVVLHAAQEVRVKADGLAAPASVQKSIAPWAEGRLIFEDQPLGQVVAEIQRYRRGVVIFRESRLKELRINGRFDITRAHEVLDRLAKTLSLRITSITPWLVIIG